MTSSPEEGGVATRLVVENPGSLAVRYTPKNVGTLEVDEDKASHRKRTSSAESQMLIRLGV